ncbi:MAG: deoxyribonuclease IV [Actinobacteria bacterium]|nr:deoxyribonuclease IV [Actinomycetota bacterium]
MLIGAHVSPAGGPAKAIERGSALGARSIQIFNQNPRAWKPTIYTDEQIEAYRAAAQASAIDALLIHAVYLLNAASEDPEIREKTLVSLSASLRAGDALGATAVVLHPGSAKTGEVGPAIERAGAVIREALAQSEHCALHLENTAGAGGTLGRSWDELGGLIEAAGGDARLGICLDSCHLLSSGVEIRTADALTEAIDACERAVGPGRLGSLHLNDSQYPLGSNRDRHADIGAGELGLDGARVFLSEPRFQELPCVLETPGPDRKGPPAEELALCARLRDEGLAARA